MHEAVDEYLASGGLAEPDVYMCGPPPMVEAAEAMLIDEHGLDEQRIFSRQVHDLGRRAVRVPSSAWAVPALPDARRSGEFSWFAPAGRRATLYEDVTIDTQPSVHRHLTPRVAASASRTAAARGTTPRPRCAAATGSRSATPASSGSGRSTSAARAIEQQIEGGAALGGRARACSRTSRAEWVEFLRAFLQVPAYVEHGLWFALATAARDCLSDSVATCVCLQAAMKQRSAQAIVLYAMDLERHLGPSSRSTGRARRVPERRARGSRRGGISSGSPPRADWGEVVVAANLCFEPIVGTLIRRELGIRAAAANGDTVTPVLARAASQEWEWARAWTVALVRIPARRRGARVGTTGS